MPEVIINGPDGRLEGRFQAGKEPNAPIALILHPHPQHGGTMNNKVVYNLYHSFTRQASRSCASTFAASGAAKAVSIAGKANSPTPRPRSIGCKASTRTRKAVGLPAFPSAPGSACSF